MPTYPYKCDECSHEFEVFQNIKDDPVNNCPVCNATVRRIISGGSGLIFKGSGFYITDYKNNSGGDGKKSKASLKGSSSDRSDTSSSDSDSSKANNKSDSSKKKSESSD